MISEAFTVAITSIGKGINELFVSFFLVQDEVTGNYTLSPIAAWGVAFFAIGLVLSIVFRFIRKVAQYITKLAVQYLYLYGYFKKCKGVD